MSTDFRTNNFDLLRIFAASQVMVAHAILHLDVPAAPWLLKLVHAFPGVPIFFVISGFLISAAYERSASLGSYCRNRALRIFPGLWCCILATALLAALLGFDIWNTRALAWVVTQFSGLIYTPAFLREFGTGSYNGSLWTIPVELQFYFLLPVVYWLARERARDATRFLGLAWIVFVAIGLIASMLLASPDDAGSETGLQKLLRYSFLPHFYLFMTGVVLQRCQAHRLEWIAGKGIYWVAAYLAFHFMMPAHAASLVPNALLLAVATVAMAYTVPGAARSLLKGTDISYGVYIYHGLLVNLFVELGLTGRMPMLLVLAACTYLVGYLSWLLVERPFLRRKKQTISPTLATELPHRNWLRSMFAFAWKT